MLKASFTRPCPNLSTASPPRSASWPDPPPSATAGSTSSTLTTLSSPSPSFFCYPHLLPDPVAPIHFSPSPPHARTHATLHAQSPAALLPRATGWPAPLCESFTVEGEDPCGGSHPYYPLTLSHIHSAARAEPSRSFWNVVHGSRGQGWQPGDVRSASLVRACSTPSRTSPSLSHTGL
jgi:hypothetical protein